MPLWENTSCLSGYCISVAFSTIIFQFLFSSWSYNVLGKVAADRKAHAPHTLIRAVIAWSPLITSNETTVAWFKNIIFSEEKKSLRKQEREKLYLLFFCDQHELDEKESNYVCCEKPLGQLSWQSSSTHKGLICAHFPPANENVPHFTAPASFWCN